METKASSDQHLLLLNELSTRLQSLLEAEDFYQEIVDLIQRRFHYYSILICNVAADGSATLQAQAGAYKGHLKKGFRFPSGQGITCWVIKNQKSYLSNDVSQDKNYMNLSEQVRTRSELCVPVLRDGRAIAILNVESDQLGAFAPEDVATMEAVASQIAVAVENRRLYQEARSFSEKLQKAVFEKTLELRRAHERIVEQQQLLQKENRALKTLVTQDSATKLDFVGQSPAVQNVLAMVDKIAPTAATVLIQGESGTGKELIARRLHYKSERAHLPYVTVNCGALQETLLESELFGHEKGSFTGANTQKMGLCETADGGTLFLDEIGELSLPIQAKLLRFLQEGEFYRVGGKKPIKVDVRIVSATNRDLETEVRANRFREDLFYRLNTITLRMPPLRKRREDIASLVEYFLKTTRGGPGTAQRPLQIDPQVIEVLSAYDWPGNIRELQNTVERMKILCEGERITLTDVPSNIRANSGGTELGRATAHAVRATQELDPDLPLDTVEKNHILRTLQHHSGNKTKAAQSLGITIKTLYNKLHRYGVLTTPAAQEISHETPPPSSAATAAKETVT